MAYAVSGATLQYLGDADLSEAWGLPTVIGALTVWYVSWAVFSRSDVGKRRRGRRRERDPRDD